ncbi:MAG TPA: P-loop NTPase [Candidatus Norongarragalinales archaeon]|nr:P-loop NTPase [Candidatus Norongarragalinales archaeon]
MEKVKGTMVIGVISGKGGVGKSVVAVNTASLLAKLGRQVALVDADLSNPSVSLHLGLSYTPIGIQEVLSGKNRASDGLMIHPLTGLRVLPASLKYKPDVTLKNLKAVLGSLDAYDFVIVDSPPGITEDVEHILEACDKIVIVTTPDIPSITSASKIVSLCKDMKTEVAGIIANRVTNSNYELTEKEIRSLSETEVICGIPEDDNVPASIAVRLPVVLFKPNSAASQNLRVAAMFLSGEGAVAAGKASAIHRFFAWLKRMLKVR